MKTKFYYIRDKKKAPVVTVCLLDDGEVTSRGISICSKTDNPYKKIGRKHALARARKACGTRLGCDDPLVINRDENEFSKMMIDNGGDHIESYYEYDCQLSEFEKRLVG